MGVQPLDGEHATGLSDLLAIGFGTTVAMWAVGYVGHMPLTDVSPLVFVSLMLLCLVAGGWVVGRKTLRGVRGGFGLGLIVALLNLLILGSTLAAPNTGQIVPQAWLWVPGYFVVCLALTAAGAAAGRASREQAGHPGYPLAGRESGSRERGGHDSTSPLMRQNEKVSTSPDWLAGFAWTACGATLLLIAVGGLVTGFRAGMAVPDWPNTYGSNMFLYPLAKMTGGVFYEHAHRLLGSLVGLTTLTLAVLLSIERRSKAALVLVWIVGLFVLLQGIMGGLRVTDNNTHLAVVHGFFAHVILAGMVGVAALLTPPSRAAKETDLPARRSLLPAPCYACNAPLPNETDCILATLLVLAILGQTLLGTFVRQMGVGLLIHVSVAMLVAVLAIWVGVRLWGLYPHIKVFARGGVTLMGVVILQLILGAISLVNRTPPAAASPSAQQLQSQPDALLPAVHAILTTAHQTMAALLLAIATLLAFRAWRLMSLGATAAKPKLPVANAETATTV